MYYPLEGSGADKQILRFLQEKLPDGAIGKPPPIEQCPPAPANLEVPEGETDTIITYRIPTSNRIISKCFSSCW